jgi:NodT family efflux transporter outer membrane factor (OMF) lipoprotein
MRKSNWLRDERNDTAMEGSSPRLTAPQAAFPTPKTLTPTPSLSSPEPTYSRQATSKGRPTVNSSTSLTSLPSSASTFLIATVPGLEFPVTHRNKRTSQFLIATPAPFLSCVGMVSLATSHPPLGTPFLIATRTQEFSTPPEEINRQPGILEPPVSYRKQRTGPQISRQLSQGPYFPFSIFTSLFSNTSRHFFAALSTSLFAFSLLFVGGCTVGPNYGRPPVDAPPAYKEASNFKQAAPSDQTAKGKWWEIYQDPQLNALEEQVSVSNLNIKSAQAQFLAARAAVRISRSALFPNATGSLSVSRTDQSQNKALFSSTEQKDYNDFQIPVDVSYEPDVWGRVRRTVEASRSEAQATAADLASIELSFHAELAMDYFELRGLDAQQQLFDSTVESYEEALKLTKNRYDGGLASAVDYAQAQTQLETTRAQAQDVGVQRSAMEHAIAALIGKPASSFGLPASPLTIPPPPFPAGLPSDLLERRPDVAAAERRVQEANAQIGVARAAYFPLVQLGGSGGFDSAAIGTLLQGPSGFWSLAGAAAETLFDGGQRRGATEQAKALFDKSVDDYRLTVLTSFQEVEDNLAALRILEQEAKTQDAAVAAAEHSLSLSNTRYRGGVANYLEVTTAQSAALLDERAAVDILTRRMAASVLLIKAIGGGWNVSQIPRV